MNKFKYQRAKRIIKRRQRRDAKKDTIRIAVLVSFLAILVVGILSQQHL